MSAEMASMSGGSGEALRREVRDGGHGPSMMHVWSGSQRRVMDATALLFLRGANAMNVVLGA